MAELYLLVFGSLAAGIVLAIVWWLIWGRKAGRLAGAVSGFTIAAGLLALLGELAVRLMSVSMLLPFDISMVIRLCYLDYRFTFPLVFGILGVVLLSFPVRARHGQGTAELTRRSPASFTRARWLVTPGVALALIILVTVVAGVASRPDSETGQYTMYWVEPGGQFGVGTNIYGWFYSVPALILIGVLIVITVVNLTLIARAAMAEDRERDISERTIRTRNIIAAVTGALLLHLGLIFHSLSSTASMRGSFATPDGPMTITPPFSAFGPAFDGVSILCTTLGVALWAAVVFSAIPSRRRVLDTSRP